MIGKQKCRILKEIRQRIADENDIPYVTRECGFQGECRGTCPRCESELRYLERQLALRTSMKKSVTIAALCAGMALATAGCSSNVSSPKGTSADIEETELSGEVPYDYTGDNTDETTESPDSSTCTTQDGSEQTTDQNVKQDPNSGKGGDIVDVGPEELMGDVPYLEEPEER